MWLLFAFISIPLIEIMLFIQLGSLIGLWFTLLTVLITAVIGTILVARARACRGQSASIFFFKA